jgi:steroid delta-isomerase-like uncharacterized protein
VSEANKQIIRDLEDALNRRDFPGAGELFADDVLFRGMQGAPFQGSRALYMHFFKDIINTFPDQHTTIDRLFAEDDWVIELMTFRGTHRVRATVAHHGVGGIEPTGKAVSVKQAHFWRIRDGKIIEHEPVRDDLGMHRQLGLAPESLI